MTHIKRINEILINEKRYDDFINQIMDIKNNKLIVKNTISCKRRKLNVDPSSKFINGFKNYIKNKENYDENDYSDYTMNNSYLMVDFDAEYDIYESNGNLINISFEVWLDFADSPVGGHSNPDFVKFEINKTPKYATSEQITCLIINDMLDSSSKIVETICQKLGSPNLKFDCWEFMNMKLGGPSTGSKNKFCEVLRNKIEENI